MENPGGLRDALRPSCRNLVSLGVTNTTDRVQTNDRTLTNDRAKALGDQVRDMIRTGALNPFSAIDIVRAATTLGANFDTIEAVVEEIAKGADGIGGTADDLIPMSTMSLLRTLLHSGAVRDILGWFWSGDSSAAENTPPKSAGVWRLLSCWK